MRLPTEFEGKLTITKLNIDQNPATAPKYGIRGIPTLLLFKTVKWQRPRLVHCPKAS
jgi:thioredoxin-like negative regulator of GroEL